MLFSVISGFKIIEANEMWIRLQNHMISHAMGMRAGKMGIAPGSYIGLCQLYASTNNDPARMSSLESLDDSVQQQHLLLSQNRSWKRIIIHLIVE